MPDLDETIDKLVKGIQHSHRMSHGSVVITAAAILDRLLQRAIKTKMRVLSNKLSKRLFEDYGPLGTFAAKIDVAYAMHIT